MELLVEREDGESVEERCAGAGREWPVGKIECSGAVGDFQDRGPCKGAVPVAQRAWRSRLMVCLRNIRSMRCVGLVWVVLVMAS